MGAYQANLLMKWYLDLSIVVLPWAERSLDSTVQDLCKAGSLLPVLANAGDTVVTYALSHLRYLACRRSYSKEHIQADVSICETTVYRFAGITERKSWNFSTKTMSFTSTNLFVNTLDCTRSSIDKRYGLLSSDSRMRPDFQYQTTKMIG